MEPSTTTSPTPTTTPTTPPAIIFDIDGTLANSWRLGYDATISVLNKNNYNQVEITEEIYHAHCIYPTPDRLARHAGFTPGSETFKKIGNELGKQFDEHYVQLVSSSTCAFYPGILQLLQQLPKEIKLGALTNACKAYADAVFFANCPPSLSSRFTSIHGADSVPAPKPSPKGLFQCARELGIQEEEEISRVIYVGDSVGDGRAARGAGMVSVGVVWGSNSEEKLKGAGVFDFIVESVEELREVLVCGGKKDK